jgi:imidazolonepropionase-like amidohydrolase
LGAAQYGAQVDGDDLGTIEPGKIADLTFLGSDPLVDIRNTRDVRRIMRGVADLHGHGSAATTVNAELAEPAEKP